MKGAEGLPEMEIAMRHGIRMVLLAGVALAAGIGAALAQMEPPPPAPDLYGPGPMHGRMADRLLNDFDLNHDGKITKAEVAKVEAQRFAAATGGSASMTEAQFVASHEKMLRQHSDAMFRRIDWNGDGILSLQEFAAPIRARFEMMDRTGAGEISCKAPMRGGVRGRPGMRGHFGHFRGAHFAKICQEADLNHDGKVTRAEADKVIAQKYAAAVKGGKGMTPDEFYQLAKVRFAGMEDRRFQHLDTNHDGKLSEAEFAAPGGKIFARLDRNHDGVLTKDELTSPPHHGPRGGWGRKPG